MDKQDGRLGAASTRRRLEFLAERCRIHADLASPWAGLPVISGQPGSRKNGSFSYRRETGIRTLDASSTTADQLEAQGFRVLAVAVGPPEVLKIAGMIALSDPPRSDSAALIAE